MRGLLRRAGLQRRLPEVQRWYNGYLFGGQVIYNPWSVLSFLKFQPERPAPYWADTSGNDLVRELLMDTGAGSHQEWAALLQGGPIERPITEQVVLRELAGSPDLLWSILLFTGYLKVRRGGARTQEGALWATLAIPNEEVRTIYRTRFTDWLKQGLGGDRRSGASSWPPCWLAMQRPCERHLGDWLMRSVSFYDTAQGGPAQSASTTAWCWACW